jgi:xanthine dehydrogenase accessory factor
MKELQAILRALTAPAASSSHVLATLVTVAGSSYRRPGARLLLSENDQRIGSISGGCLEEDVVARAQAVARTGQAEVITYDTSEENDLVWGVGLGCHGVVQILLEKLPPHPPWVATLASNLASRRPTPLSVVWRADDPKLLGTRLGTDEAPDVKTLPVVPTTGVFFDVVVPPPALFIFGAGDDARPLFRFAKELGWHVSVADPRRAFATADRFSGAHALHVAPASELVAHAAPPADALAVVMTHHYIHDVPILADLLRRPLAYVGLLGPRKRAEKILADLHLPPGDLARLHAPVGLDLGAETPEDVALSILAEMRAVLGRRDGRPLKERILPIHD